MSKAHNGVNSIDVIKNFLPQSLAETPGNDDFFNSAAALAIDEMLDGVEGLDSGWSDKTACVDNDNIRIISLKGYRETRRKPT